MKYKLNNLLIASVLACSVQGVIAEENIVHVYNWSDYIDEQVNTDFTAATGIKVVYDVFDSNEVLEAKLLAGGSGYEKEILSACGWQMTVPLQTTEAQQTISVTLDQVRNANRSGSSGRQAKLRI